MSASQGISPSINHVGTNTDCPLCSGLDLDDICAEAKDGELDGLWTTITIFISLFLLSVCYSASVTLFKVIPISSTILTISTLYSSCLHSDSCYPYLSHTVSMSFPCHHMSSST